MSTDLNRTDLLRAYVAESRDLAVEPEGLHDYPAQTEEHTRTKAEERTDSSASHDALGIDICACAAEAEGIA